MFVLQKLLNHIDSEQKAWQKRCDVWVKEDDYGYRSERDYEQRYPSPKAKIHKLITAAIIVFMASTAIATIIFVIINVENKRPDEKPKKVSSLKNGDTCLDYRIGDTGSVEYGDYEGAQVGIVGGCEDYYEVIVLKDQTLFAEGSRNSAYDDKQIKAGLKFRVNNSRNLSITGHEDLKKE